MKNKAAGFLKRIASVLASLAKAKTMALKTKTNTLRTRLIIFSLLRNKKVLMTSISDKLQALMGHHHKEEEQDQEERSQAIVVYNHNSMSLPSTSPTHEQLLAADQELDNYLLQGDVEEEHDNKYPDLTHSLFESEEMEFEDPGGSVIDMVKNSKQEAGEEFRLEDEIDRVADLFIRRFHNQMRMQKQLSFKRYQEILQRGA